ncbi:MAG: putative endonuclease containing a domain [Oscillospiraceae bacterium]|jgi:putative endonuclease|nr:putative endonuclease containing a domain [Oscillospiraceae bacterium]
MCRPAFAYLLKCADGTLYAGWTNDPDARLTAHNNGVGAKYTRGRRPVVFAYLEHCNDKRAAMRREAELKRMTRAQKLALINAQTMYNA